MRGVKIAVVVMCIGLSISVLGSMGWFGWVGVHPDPGIDSSETQKEMEEVGGESSGGGSDFGIVRAAANTFNVFRSLIGQIAPALVNLGVPRPIAVATEAVSVVAMGVSVVMLVRGVVWR